MPQSLTLRDSMAVWEARASPRRRRGLGMGGHLAKLSTRLLVSGRYWSAARYQSFRSLMENAGCAHGVNLGPQDSEPRGYT